MTKKQIKQFNEMVIALRRISKGYLTPQQLREYNKNIGLEYEEALEMSYENMQTTATQAVRNVRIINSIN